MEENYFQLHFHSLTNKKFNFSDLRRDSGLVDFQSLENFSDRLLELSKREKEVFAELLDGHTNKEVARRLSISPRTAEVHRRKILEKLEVKNIVVATRFFSQISAFVEMKPLVQPSIQNDSTVLPSHFSSWSVSVSY